MNRITLRRVGLLALVLCLALAPGAAVADETLDDTVNDTTDTENLTVNETVNETLDETDSSTDTVTETVVVWSDSGIVVTNRTTSAEPEETSDEETAVAEEPAGEVNETTTESGDDLTVTWTATGVVVAGPDGEVFGSMLHLDGVTSISDQIDVSNATLTDDVTLIGIDTTLQPGVDQPQAPDGESLLGSGPGQAVGTGPDGGGTDGSATAPGGSGNVLAVVTDSIPSLPDGMPPAGVLVGVAGLAAAVAIGRQGMFTAGSGGAPTVKPAADAVVVAGSDLLDRLVRTFYPLRYSRYDDSDPLEHDARIEMADAIEAAPGSYLSEVSDRAGLPLSTARHHMRVLEREGIVASAKVRGRRRFFPSNTDGMELAAALNDDATATILDALFRLGPCSVSGLADELGKDPSTVTHHLKRLADGDVVIRERDGRAVVTRLTPEAAAALEPDLEADATRESVASAD